MKDKRLIISSLVSVAVVASAFITLASSMSELLPASDGFYTQWIPSAGTFHFPMVNETPCNGTMNYNSTNTVGSRDSYGVSLASIPNGSEITQIGIAPCASNNKAGPSSVLNIFYRLNSVNSADAGSYTLSGTTPTQLATTSYGGLLVVKGSGTILEIGGVLTSGSKGARLSRIAATITYTPLNAPTSTTVSASSTGVGILWNDNSSIEDNFDLERSINGGVFFHLATTSANVTSYLDDALSPGTYAYRVRAYNSGVYSNFSNSATTTLP